MVSMLLQHWPEMVTWMCGYGEYQSLDASYCFQWILIFKEECPKLFTNWY